jgi:hypothetical protein
MTHPGMAGSEATRQSPTACGQRQINRAMITITFGGTFKAVNHDHA